MSEPLLKVENLKKHFPINDNFFFSKNSQYLKAVDGVNLEVFKGETFGIVGESGCGKSTLSRVINKLLSPTDGTVSFMGKKISSLSNSELRDMRKKIQMVFQNPYGSLDPRKTIEYLIMEPLNIHGVGTIQERKKKVHEVLERVGLNTAHSKRYPHEFSGGQRQRINIARAIILNPDLIICDEPVSALDVSVQAQIINLLKDLQSQYNLTYLFISHDLGVVRYVSDRIAVMYLGKIVELGSYKDIYNNQQHPYTKALLSATPIESPFEKKERLLLSGETPSPINPPSGCPFHKRCPHVVDECMSKTPELREFIPGHYAACHLMGKIPQIKNIKEREKCHSNMS
ncbi:ABC transporter ATP-binding protein [Alteribacter populi]|uniref:ABC transporter ATP-binding protein n=1 Tax=Alteribacter populi TaxID=2011011 RepID=UPI000BBAE28C|nr:dipeptide ABC transporter ATP-binding protein [Alteribacter populi]